MGAVWAGAADAFMMKIMIAAILAAQLRKYCNAGALEGSVEAFYLRLAEQSARRVSHSFS